MESFQKRYEALNLAQKAAVDTIDGPLMVVAGPGTGKTELLSVRVANILEKTDVSAQNILCLTFTDSGVRAMRERLSGLIGNLANKVAIHTFHNFGQEIINSYGEFFYNGAQFQPADDLAAYEIISPILANLPHGSALKAQLNGRYTYLGDIKKAISNLKRGGLYPDELGDALEDNQAFIDWLKPHLQPVFNVTMNKKLFPDIGRLVAEIRTYRANEQKLGMFKPLSHVIADSLEAALNQAEETDKTQPLTEWKRRFLAKDSRGEQTLKDAARTKKLFEVKEVYRQYLSDMESRGLYDFDDMILRVIHALETHDQLRYQLQETYQYILVDEFQDTNDAQMRLLWNMTNNPAHEGSPNIMVVGDDDQAIYRFQGADMSNIMEFAERYKNVTMITLTDNYRSHADILSLARQVITQASDRLENRFEQLDKVLQAKNPNQLIELDQQVFSTSTDLRHRLAIELKTALTNNPSESRAVIARNHRQIKSFLPYLQTAGVPLIYEHEENILESEPVKQIELLANVVVSLAHSHHDTVNQLLPELLSHPAWQVKAQDLWRLSLEAYQSKLTWLEVMQTLDGQLKDIADWLIESSRLARYETLEAMIDRLFGTPNSQVASEEHDDAEPFEEVSTKDFSSPFYSYFFGDHKLDDDPLLYLTYLDNLKTLRETVRAFRPQKQLKLADFVECLSLHRELELSIRSLTNVSHDERAITLLTAHKAKGLEFDSVYVIDAQEEIWGSRARNRGSLISFPANLPLELAGNNDDERLRLLYVTLTRAKSKLHILASQQNDAGRDQSLIGVLQTDNLLTSEQTSENFEEKIAAVTADWRRPYLALGQRDRHEILKPRLDRYKLSATHLNNFIDVASSGPELFLLHNLLHFPQSMSPHASYGSAIHKVLQIAHQHYKAHQEHKPLEDLVADFERELLSHRLNKIERESLVDRGSHTLRHFFAERQDSFSLDQDIEHNFAQESILIGDARLSGAIDLIDIDKTNKTIRVTDYKTGKAFSTWQGKTEYDKVKLHKYEQQLMFYKILIENSRHFAGYTVTGGRLEFVEPNENDEVILLDYAYDADKLENFTKLINAVWQRIQKLDFSLGQEYEPTLKGVKAFEDDLRTEIN